MFVAGTDAARAQLQRPLIASLTLLVVYVALSFANSTDGYLGTDTGAKVATLEEMDRRDTFRPAVGYWAEEWDPDGLYHPLIYTRYTDDGEWVNVTTLPMLEAAYPLYELGGYRLALLWPILGSIAAAFACRDLARLLSSSDGWSTFWIVGLGSPMLIYALDFWEHSAGAALMVASTALLARAVVGDTRIRFPLAAGAALGLAATMRTETFVFALVVVGLACLWIAVGGRIVRAALTGLLTIAGFVVPWTANTVLERALGGNARASRVSGAAQQSVGGELADRLREAGITWFGLPGLGDPSRTLVGVMIVGIVLVAAVLARRGELRSARIGLLIAPVLLGIVLIGAGWSFVPGALVASPLAIAAFWAVDRLDTVGRFVITVALAATVGIWLLQFLGGAGPQWGGRYILGPTLLLTTIGITQLRVVPKQFGSVLVATAVLVSFFGAAWLSVRSHGVDQFFDDLAERDEDVVVVTNGFLVREAGSAYGDRLYLSLHESADLAGAVDIVRESGLDSFAVLDDGEDPPDVDADLLGSDVVEFLGVPLWYHRYTVEP